MSIVLVGSTSGSCTLQEQAIAGNTVLTLPTTSGTILTTGSSGQSIPKAALPTGSVLQVVTATYNTTTSTTSSTAVSTGLSASITPLFSTSRVLIIISMGDTATSTAGQGVQFYIIKNGTTLPRFASQMCYVVSSGGLVINNGPTTQYIDSPASTSSQTYTVAFSANVGNTATVQRDSTPSTITLMEIAS